MTKLVESNTNELLSISSHITKCLCECAQLLSCNLMDCSPPGSSVHGIFQARILEWAATLLLQGIFSTQGLNPLLLHWQVDFFTTSDTWEA